MRIAALHIYQPFADADRNHGAIPVGYLGTIADSNSDNSRSSCGLR